MQDDLTGKKADHTVIVTPKIRITRTGDETKCYLLQKGAWVEIHNTLPMFGDFDIHLELK
jgi:hypothetical protein